MRYVAIWMLSLALAAADPLVVSLLTPWGEQLPDCIYDGAAPTWVDGGNLIALAGNDVVAINAVSGHQAWRARAPAGNSLRALSQSGHRLFMSRVPERTDDGWNFDGCGEVLVLDLASGAWLDPLTVAPPAEHQVLVDAVVEVHDRLIIAWHRWVAAHPDWRQEELIVSSIAKGKTVWTRRWLCQVPVPAPGAYVLSGPQQTTAQERVVPLLSWGDALIVCPGPTSSILAIGEADGADRWRVERLWEFDRDFIGPSVWCHELRRFGRDAEDEAWRRAGTKTINVTAEDKAAVDAQLPGVIADWQKDFTAHHSAWLAGGPWLVPRPLEDGNHPADAILVAVAIAPVHPFARNLAQVRLYDLGESGEPVALKDLPRPPRMAQVVGDRLVFAGMTSGVGAISPFPWSGPHGGMGGGPDCLLSLAWYTEVEEHVLDAWLQEKRVAPAVIGKCIAVVPCDGGAIQQKGDEMLRAELDLMALPSGEHQRCTVRVRIGKVQLPKTNYGQFTRKDGSLGTIAHTAMGGDAPTAYSVINDRLIVTLGQSKQAVFTLKQP